MNTYLFISIGFIVGFLLGMVRKLREENKELKRRLDIEAGINIGNRVYETITGVAGEKLKENIAVRIDPDSGRVMRVRTAAPDKIR